MMPRPAPSRRVARLEAVGLFTGVVMLVGSLAAFDIRLAVALLGLVIILISIDLPRRRP